MFFLNSFGFLGSSLLLCTRKPINPEKQHEKVDNFPRRTAVVHGCHGTGANRGQLQHSQQQQRVIMSPNVYAYIDHPQLKDYGKQPRTTDSYIVSCSKMYSFEPIIPEELTEEEQQCILGVQANLWTEHVAYPEHMFYQLLPRLASMSEVQWCRPDQKDFEDFKTRLPHLQKFYERLGIPYCRQVE